VFGVVTVFCAARLRSPLSVTGSGNRPFSNPQSPEGLLGTPRLFSVRHRVILRPRQTDRNVKPTPHFSILPTLTLGGAIPLFPYVPSWCVQRHVCLYLYHYKHCQIQHSNILKLIRGQVLIKKLHKGPVQKWPEKIGKMTS